MRLILFFFPRRDEIIGIFFCKFYFFLQNRDLIQNIIFHVSINYLAHEFYGFPKVDSRPTQSVALPAAMMCVDWTNQIVCYFEVFFSTPLISISIKMLFQSLALPSYFSTHSKKD